MTGGVWLASSISCFLLTSICLWISITTSGSSFPCFSGTIWVIWDSRFCSNISKRLLTVSSSLFCLRRSGLEVQIDIHVHVVYRNFPVTIFSTLTAEIWYAGAYKLTKFLKTKQSIFLILLDVEWHKLKNQHFCFQCL